jgi:hypothetical protein
LELAIRIVLLIVFVSLIVLVLVRDRRLAAEDDIDVLNNHQDADGHDDPGT